MKQNPLEAKPAAVAVTLLIALVLSSDACVRRPRQTQFKPQATLADSSRLNINTATAQDLEQLPGIGPVIAERIVEHRSQYGPFRRVEHVMMVRGLSERKFRDLEPLITVQNTP